MKKIYVLISLLVMSMIAIFFYIKEGALPVNSLKKTPVQFSIERGQSVTEIINRLHRQDLIRNKIVFLIVIKRLGIDGKIQAGEYQLSASMSAYEIARALTRGITDTWITIVEGLRKEEIAQIVSKELSIPESEFIRLAREGYLFPDTYLIPKESTAQAVLEFFYGNFNKKYTEREKEKALRLNLTDDEVIALASIVEKEAKTDSDRKQVASILLKRLRNRWPLEVDASIQYALGYQPSEKTWWKKDLTFEDLKLDSPYNTRKNSGLPPGPICNPGLSSIKAVLEADPTTPYWFYISNKDGSNMHFTETLQQHEETIKKNLR